MGNRRGQCFRHRYLSFVSLPSSFQRYGHFKHGVRSRSGCGHCLCIAVYCCMLMVGKQQKLNFPHWCGYCVLAGHCVLLNKGRCGLFGSAALLLPAQLGHLPKTSTGKIRNKSRLQACRIIYFTLSVHSVCLSSSIL